MVILFVKFKSSLSESELAETAEERAPKFRALPGLIQKYYVKENQTGEVAGIYLWDSAESLQEFQQSELIRSLPEAYKIESPPRIEVLDVVFTLRPEDH